MISKSTSKFLRDGIQERLLMNSEHIITGRWIEAMGLMALPPNAIESLKYLSELTDGLWYLAGDRSSDVTDCTFVKTIANCNTQPFLR